MSYEVLARKWRPQTFDEVVGQDHITRTLKRAVESDRLSHAYMFAGPRGCGKTSTARILAKVINCTDIKKGNPCNKCASCTGVIEGKNLDVMEIDGASHTGVGEVRDLQESIGYAASQFARKVYIIDEVHMLSTHAFNALLKTLEEPPSHVYFIFATTAPQKDPRYDQIALSASPVQAPRGSGDRRASQEDLRVGKGEVRRGRPAPA